MRILNNKENHWKVGVDIFLLIKRSIGDSRVG
jgi:hypothetical protein